MARPDGIVTGSSTLSGTEPSNWCQNEYRDLCADRVPLPPARMIRHNSTRFCASSSDGPRRRRWNVPISAKEWLDTGDGRNWLENNGLPRDPYFAPERECRSGDPQPVIALNLTDGQIIVQPLLQINGSANAEQGFRRWRLGDGLGPDPSLGPDYRQRSTVDGGSVQHGYVRLPTVRSRCA
jgi:hypothetical protein